MRSSPTNYWLWVESWGWVIFHSCVLQLRTLQMTWSRALALFDADEWKSSPSSNSFDRNSLASSITVSFLPQRSDDDGRNTSSLPLDDQSVLAVNIRRLAQINKSFLASRWIPETSTVCARLAEHNADRSRRWFSPFITGVARRLDFTSLPYRGNHPERYPWPQIKISVNRVSFWTAKFSCLKHLCGEHRRRIVPQGHKRGNS